MPRDSNADLAEFHSSAAGLPHDLAIYSSV